MEEFNNDSLLSEDAFMEEGDFDGLETGEFIEEEEEDFSGIKEEEDELDIDL